MNKTWLIMLLLLIPATLALDQVLRVDLTFYKEGKVDLKGLFLDIGSPTLPSKRGSYVIQVLDSQKNPVYSAPLYVTFLRTESLEEVDSVTRPVYLPYSPESKEIQLQKDGRVLLSIPVLLCNHNERCEEYENYNSCLDDCPSGSKDGYCDTILDGKCDSDCDATADIDCTCGNKVCDGKETERTCPVDCKLSLWQRFVRYLKQVV